MIHTGVCKLSVRFGRLACRVLRASVWRVHHTPQSNTSLDIHHRKVGKDWYRGVSIDNWEGDIGGHFEALHSEPPCSSPCFLTLFIIF